MHRGHLASAYWINGSGKKTLALSLSPTTLAVHPLSCSCISWLYSKEIDSFSQESQWSDKSKFRLDTANHKQDGENLLDCRLDKLLLKLFPLLCSLNFVVWYSRSGQIQEELMLGFQLKGSWSGSIRPCHWLLGFHDRHVTQMESRWTVCLGSGFGFDRVVLQCYGKLEPGNLLPDWEIRMLHDFPHKTQNSRSSHLFPSENP